MGGGRGEGCTAASVPLDSGTWIPAANRDEPHRDRAPARWPAVRVPSPPTLATAPAARTQRGRPPAASRSAQRGGELSIAPRGPPPPLPPPSLPSRPTFPDVPGRRAHRSGTAMTASPRRQGPAQMPQSSLRRALLPTLTDQPQSPKSHASWAAKASASPKKLTPSDAPLTSPAAAADRRRRLRHPPSLPPLGARPHRTPAAAARPCRDRAP